MAKDDDIDWSTCNVGCAVRGGGNVFRKTGGIVWIIAPSTAEWQAPWPMGHCTGAQNNGSTPNRAQRITGRDGWFIPDLTMLQTACSCKTYWDSYQTCYWSAKEKYRCAGCAYSVNFNGAGGAYCVRVKPTSYVWARPVRVICY